MKVRLICAGKIKEPYLRKGIDYYKSQLGKKVTVELIEVEDEKTPDRASIKEEDQIRRVEGERILRHIPQNSFVFALCIDGQQMTTEQLRRQILWPDRMKDGHVTFVIGGSLGLSPDVIRRADEKISFSKMTFPHQMMRMILLEQLNRVFAEG